jgi:hypothetical protein
MSERLLEAIRFNRECSHDHIDDLESFLWLLIWEYLMQGARHHALSDDAKDYLDGFDSSSISYLLGVRARIERKLGSRNNEKHFLSLAPLFNALFQVLRDLEEKYRTKFKTQREWKETDILATYLKFLEVGYNFINDPKNKERLKKDWKPWFAAETTRYHT